MAKKTEKELEIQRLDKKTPLQMLWDYVTVSYTHLTLPTIA